MATIRTSIQITDGMSPAFNSMNKALNIVLNSFEAVQSASGKAVDTSSIQAARDELARSEVIISGIEEEIKEASRRQEELNDNMKNGTGAASGLLDKIKGIAVTMGIAFSAKKVIGLADSMTSTTARLDLMNDGLQTTAELQDRILRSANASRGSYQTTADAVAKMGILAKDAFSSNTEVIAFVEQLNKQFTISGTSAQGVGAAMLQLTQAMGQGVLRGEELNSVFEQAPTIVQSIADYLDVPIGQIRNMAAEGLITSDVVKNAMFATAEETNAKFAEMPMTFAQVGTIVGNTLLQTFEPVIQAVGRGAQFIYDNWSNIEPVFWGLAAAVGAYTAVIGIQTAATWLAEKANRANAIAMLKNPAIPIAIAIGALIMMIVKWVQSVGGLEIAWAIAMHNIMIAWDVVKIGFFTGIYWVLGLWDKLTLGLKTASVGIQNFMGDMKVAVLLILQNMVNGAIDIINGFINTLNKIPGVSIDAIQNVTFGTSAQLENEAAKRSRKADLAEYRSQIEARAAERDATLDQMMADAIEASAKRQADISVKQAEAVANTAQGTDYTALLGLIGDNTGKTADTIDMSAESLEYLRDLAEQEVINRFTTAEIKVELGGVTNNVSQNTDLGGLVTYLEETLYETMESAAEGVHG